MKALRTADWFLFLVLIALLLSDSWAAAQPDRSQGRSMVISRNGIVASEHPLASQAGAMILEDGGTAVDAAIAANAVMGLVSPMMCGIGGDLFALVYDARAGKVYGLNASGWSPASLTLEFARNRGWTNVPVRGIHSVTVPGCVDGWDKLRRRFGRKKFAEILAAAIEHAEQGVPVSELVSGAWSDYESALRPDPNAVRTFLPAGRPPRTGELFRNPDLAWCYRQIAADGREAFYRGRIARRILDCSRRLGGELTAADLGEFESEWVDPISTTYRGWTVYELPPNGQGIAALLMLNLMENFPLADYGHHSARALHVMIEAKKLAYADLIRYVADPRFSRPPVQGLLSKEYARDRARQIDLERANCRVESGVPPEIGADTTYLCVTDREGNMVSLIQSIYFAFGSGVAPEDTGFLLQNRGHLFTLEAGHPNALAGRKRTFHTIIPGMMARDQVRIAFGIMGGFNQAQAHAQFVANVVDHQINIQAALEAARFTKLSFTGCDVQIERRVPENVRAQLEAKGHQLDVKGDFTQFVGGGQAILRDDAAGVNYGASDPRKDGAAIPEP